MSYEGRTVRIWASRIALVVGACCVAGWALVRNDPSARNLEGLLASAVALSWVGYGLKPTRMIDDSVFTLSTTAHARALFPLSAEVIWETLAAPIAAAGGTAGDVDGPPPQGVVRQQWFQHEGGHRSVVNIIEEARPFFAVGVSNGLRSEYLLLPRATGTEVLVRTSPEDGGWHPVAHYEMVRNGLELAAAEQLDGLRRALSASKRDVGMTGSDSS